MDEIDSLPDYFECGPFNHLGTSPKNQLVCKHIFIRKATIIFGSPCFLI